MAPGGEGTRSRHLGVLICAVLLAYANALRGAFQFDDFKVIVDNPAIRSGSAWLAGAAGIRPLLKASYALNWAVDQGPLGFHFLNVVLHAANAALLYHVLCRWTAPQPNEGVSKPNAQAAFLAALLWALHPVQTEAVTYISGRSLSLMATFYLGSLLAYIRGRVTQDKMLQWGVSPLLFLLAFLTKETAVTLPMTLMLWELTGATKPRPFRGPAVHWVALGGVGLLLALHGDYRRLLSFGFQQRSLLDNLRSQIHGATWLLVKLPWPHPLNIDPVLPVFHRWTWGLAAELALLLGFLALGIWSVRRRPWLAFGILWAFLHLVPTNSVVPRLDLVNERQLYLASVGPLLVLSIGLSGMGPSRLGRAAIGGLILLLGLLTVVRNQDYRTEIALWESSLHAQPDNPRALNNLGTAYGAAGNYEGAMRSYREALRLKPDYEMPRRNLAVLEGGGWVR